MSLQNSSPNLGSIKFLTGPQANSTFQITKASITIGREANNDIVATDISISRHHAQITWNDGVWAIVKLAPQNTLKVNQLEVQQSPIKDQDIIGLGAIKFIFQPTAGVANLPPAANATKLVPQTQLAPPPPPTPPQPPLRGQGNAPMTQFTPLAPPPQPVVAAMPFSPTVAVPSPAFSSGTEPIPPGIEKLAAGTPSLEISSNTHKERPVYPLDKQVINIGRHPDNDIVINDTVVSGFHVQIVREGNQLTIIHPHPQHQKTTNGILYKGYQITGDKPFRKPLERGDIFRIGNEEGTWVTLTYNDGSGAIQEILPVIRPIPLGASLITIGRRPDNTVILNHPQVSGQHARLELIQGGQGGQSGYRLVDAGSTNGVYVNGQRISNQLLKSGDEIHIGPFKLTYTGTQLTQYDEGSSIRVDAINLKKVGNNRTILINDISIAIPPRKFVALVGGSGAGKSTLMDALNGLRPAQQGKVFYNGKDYYKHLAAFSSQLGYVPQDDIVHRDLTVERALYYAAKMRLPSDFTEEQITQRINEVLEDVEMTFRRKLLVNKLSGGQRKRVSIALELLANPSIFFLDEPTSGLDPGLDRKMMYLLRKLADKGHTIVLVTHATNNINACDYVCFLSQGGRLAYFGPPDMAKTYFEKTDFAEIYTALEPTEANPNIPAEAEARFRSSPYFQQYVDTPLRQGPAARMANLVEATATVKPPRRGDPLKQLMLLCMRYLELLKNDRGNLLILILQAPIIAVILFFLTSPDVFATNNVITCPPNSRIPQTVSNKFDCQNEINFFTLNPQGIAFVQQHNETAVQATQQFIEPVSGGNAQKILFIMAFAAVMFGCVNGAREIVKEEAIYRRERTVNLGIIPYMFSKIIVLGVLCLFQSAILVIVVGIRAPFPHGTFLPPLMEIYISLALTSLAGLMLGLAVSAVAPNNDRATSFIPIILIPQVIFSGVIFSLNNAGLQFLGSFFAARWSMAAMGSSIGLNGTKLGDGSDFAYQGTLFSTASQGQAVFHLLLMWFALIVMILALGGLTAYFLKRKDVRA